MTVEQDVKYLRRMIAALQNAVRALYTVVKKFEFGISGGACPICGKGPSRDHRPAHKKDCELRGVLEEVEALTANFPQEGE